MFLQLQVHRGVHRRSVRGVSPGGAEDQAHATQLPRHAHPRLPVLHRPHGPLAQVSGPGDHEEAGQQGEPGASGTGSASAAAESPGCGINLF